MKNILVKWSFMAIFLVLALTCMGLFIKKQNAPYIKLERELKDKASHLIGEYPALLKDDNKITLEEFDNYNYDINMEVNHDKCDGYIIVNKNMGILKYKSYIKCNKYTTHGYK